MFQIFLWSLRLGVGWHKRSSHHNWHIEEFYLSVLLIPSLIKLHSAVVWLTSPVTQLWQYADKNTIMSASCRRQWSSIKISEQRNKGVHIVVFTRTGPVSTEICIIIGLVSGTWRKQAGGGPKATVGPNLYGMSGLKNWKHVNVRNWEYRIRLLACMLKNSSKHCPNLPTE